MRRKILIVGGVAGGASAAARLRRNNEEDQIIMFEKGPHVSFSNCSLPYHLSGMIQDAEDLVLMDPELFLTRYNIEARSDSEVLAIDRKKKLIKIKDLNSNTIYEENYDKLILSPGAFPIMPVISGIEKVNIFTIRNVKDIDMLNKFIKKMVEKEVTVIGGGFIGVETAENLRKAGFHVTLVEAANQILKPFDYDMVQIFHKVFVDNKVDLIVGDKVEKFVKDKVILASGKKIDASAVIMAIGILPETGLAKEAGIKLGITGAIKVNENYQTNDPDIYAIGDAIEVNHGITNKLTKISLAGPALKEARIVADHINARTLSKESMKSKCIKNKGYIGSSAIHVFNYSGAATGLNESTIKDLGLDIKYDVVRIILSDKVWLMPDAATMHLKLLFEIPTGKILGAQAIGKGDVTKRIDVIATAIKFGGTVEDLKELDLCYAPQFSTAKDIVNYAGYVGSNLLNEDFKQVNVDKVRDLVEKNSFLVDVRESSEFEKGHIKGAINIPLSKIRERVAEIPKDQPVYLYCRTGQRSYNAVMLLHNLGFLNIYNVAGSFLGLSFFEFYNDKTLQRESILTDYNFK